MLNTKEKTKQEIEAKLAGMGDYVKMDYLQRSLKSGLDFETKKFVMVRLASIYESRKMFLEAARLMKFAADINTTFKGKMQDYMKSVQLFIRGGDYDESDRVLKQAIVCGNEQEKRDMKENVKKYYSEQAEIYMSADKRNQAKKTYEKMLSLNLSGYEKSDIQKKLLSLYEKLGMIKDYHNLKQNM